MEIEDDFGEILREIRLEKS